MWGGGGCCYVIENSEKDNTLLRKGPVQIGKLLSFSISLVWKKKKKKDRFSVARNNAFILANLIHNRIVIVENTRVQLLVRLSKYCV